MLLKLDIREKRLIQLINTANTGYNFTIKTENLALGDIIICDDDETELLLIERKSLADLAASIKDGRYSEQSYRLNSYSLHNHNIIYLIEGNLSMFGSNYHSKNRYNPLYLLFCITRDSVYYEL
jgi:ERCC4-type nuclease